MGAAGLDSPKRTWPSLIVCAAASPPTVVRLIDSTAGLGVRLRRSPGPAHAESPDRGWRARNRVACTGRRSRCRSAGSRRLPPAPCWSERIACEVSHEARLSLLPPGSELVLADRQGVVFFHVVEVAESADDVPELLAPRADAVAFEKEGDAVLDSEISLRLDELDVVVVAHLTSVADDLELHRHQVLEAGDAQAADCLRFLQELLTAAFVGMKELNLGIAEKTLQRALPLEGDSELPHLAQLLCQRLDVHRVVVVEEIQVAALSVMQVHGYSRPAAQI